MLARWCTAIFCCGPLLWAQGSPQISEQRTLVPPVHQTRIPPRVGVFAEARLSLEQALAMALKVGELVHQRIARHAQIR